MKRIITLCLIFMMMLTMFACSKITSGEVYNKEFRPEHTQLLILPLSIYNGKSSTIIMVPYYIYYPDTYVISIKKMVNNEWKTADYYTDKETFDKTEIGYMFQYDKTRDLQEEPCTKTRAD